MKAYIVLIPVVAGKLLAPCESGADCEQKAGLLTEEVCMSSTTGGVTLPKMCNLKAACDKMVADEKAKGDKSTMEIGCGAVILATTALLAVANML